MEAEDRVARVLGEWIAAHEDGEALDVEELLRRHPDLEDELRRGLSALARVDVALGTAETPRRRLPERVGGYRVLSSLGDGGMGTVYKAVAEVENAVVPVGTTVAVKRVHPHLLRKPGYYDRLRREAELGQRIRHPNVVRTYGTGSDDADDLADHLLVMEYVEGQTLRQLTDELGQVPEELCRHIATEVAQGLQAIHEAGAVHRDLKPENVMITNDHRVKIMDLGVAWLADAQIRLSQTGIFLGSLLYASPEQIQGNAVDGRSDLYALGLVLYELACGDHPFRADASAEVIHRQLEISPRPLGEVNPQIGPFLERVVDTLIRKPADDRLVSAGDLAQVLVDGEQGKWWKKQASILCSSTRKPLRRIRIPRETEIYGRETDLDQLRTLYGKAKAGEGRVVLINGEAGIGKTRLVDEFVGRLRQQGEEPHYLFSSYPPGGAATSAGAFLTAYREHLGEGDLAARLETYLGPRRALAPAFDALLRGEPQPQEGEPLTPDSLGTAFVQLTQALAKERATVVLIDDLHFAPGDGRALFASLAHAVSGHAVLLIGTMRPGVPEQWSVDLDRLAHVSRHTLHRLGPKDLIRLLADALKSRQLAEELGGQVAHKADGNPFFAFEIIRGLREGQFITRRPDGTWVTTQVVPDIQVPDSILELVNARVSELTEEERCLLDVAACCGYEFDPIAVGDAAGQHRVPVLRCLAQVERRHRLVRAAGSTYIFDHHQVQEALYSSLADPLKQEYHTAIAEALETHSGGDQGLPPPGPGSHHVAICEHHLRGRCPERAVHHLSSALDHLTSQYLLDQAADLADRALSDPSLVLGRDRLQLLLRKSSILNLLGRRPDEEAALNEARSIAHELQDEAELRNVDLGRALLVQNTGRAEGASDLYHQLLRRACESGDTEVESKAAGMLGWVLKSLGRAEEALEYLERALRLFRDRGEADHQAAASINLANAYLQLNRSEEAAHHLEKGAQLARACGNRRWEGNAAGSLGNLLFDAGRYAEAAERYAEWLEIAIQVGDRRGEALSAGNLGNTYHFLPRYSESRTMWERSLAISREVGDRVSEGIAHGGLGIHFAAMGCHEPASGHLEIQLEIAREIGDPYNEFQALMNLAAQAWESGEIDLAIDLRERSLAICRRIDSPVDTAGNLCHLGHLYAIRGRRLDAQARWKEAVAGRFLSACPGAAILAMCRLVSTGSAQEAAPVTAYAEYGHRLSPDEDRWVRFGLWSATSDVAHLEAAKRLLDQMVRSAPEEYRESMLKNVRLNREIMEAWEEHGEASTA